ncbi:NUDIX hydrolase [Amygdalobacter nucleatus]|uniref:NUDIX hydrolase n=1 Tax=Amygdalobacter nucleatus TaxID=3029274 RepID=UPI0027A1464D|nr:NUDIX hydrolase [Amygdalobacter nucleatus]WEG36753.1 NUDIX hydrolase [Amygdalobacter nucleatus]
MNMNFAEFFNHEIDFSGTKVALIIGDKVLSTLRDDIPTIPFPDMWELPGGCREANESGFECGQREIWEELGINLDKASLLWVKQYKGLVSDKNSFFAVATISQSQIDQIKFGDEGQGYKLMTFSEFLNDSNVIPGLKVRLQDYLQATNQS